MARAFPFLAAVLGLLAGAAASAETLRIATYNTDLSADGPGVLLHDLGRDPDETLTAVIAVIQATRPDVLLLTQFDHDAKGRALTAFRDLLRSGPRGIDYGHVFAPPVNAGVPSGADFDGDTMLMGPDDALGYGKFPGDGGMAVLSRLPIDRDAARTFNNLHWRDLPDALLPVHPDGAPWPDVATQAAMRLSSRAHWDVPVILPDGGRLHLLATNPTPPLFDGPEARNQRRNHDEIAFWSRYLDGTAFPDDQGRTATAPDAPLVVLGDLNADPNDGAGLRDGIAGLLSHPRLRDARPGSAGGAEASQSQGGANAEHSGDPALDTADWRDDGPGNLRVDYVLPSAGLDVTASGVFWPLPGEPLSAEVAVGSAHRLVWIDIAPP